jgi:hypothetical protein
VRELTAAELLKLYESGLSKPPLERAVGILAVACPETPPEQIAKLTAGRRDELLLTLRELTFGARVECLVDCPACGSGLEFAFRTSEIRMPGADAAPPDAIEIEGFQIHVRLPDTNDLVAASGAAGVEQAGRRNVRRNVQSMLEEGHQARAYEESPILRIHRAHRKRGKKVHHPAAILR